MRTNKEQTEKILKLRDEYNQKVAQRRRNLFLIIPSVALISAILVISMIGFANINKSQEMMPDNNGTYLTIDGKAYAGEKSYSEFDTGERYIGSNEAIQPTGTSNYETACATILETTLSTTLSKTERVDSNTTDSSNIVEGTGGSYWSTTVSVTNIETFATTFVSVPPETYIETFETTFASTSVYYEPYASTTILSTTHTDIYTTAATEIPLTPLVFTFDIEGATYKHFSQEATPSVVKSDFIKTGSVRADGFTFEIDVYNVLDVSSEYFVLADDNGKSYILYSNYSTHKTDDFLKNLHVSDYLNSASVFSDDGITKKDLLMYIESYLSSKPVDEIRYGKATTISGAKSGLYQLYRLDFEITKDGMFNIYALSKDGQFTFASTSFKIQTHPIKPEDALALNFDVNGTKYVCYAKEFNGSGLQGKYIKTEKAQGPGYTVYLDLYYLYDIPSSYYVLAFDGESYYTLYSECSKHESAAFIDDLYVIKYLDDAILTTDSDITKNDLNTYLSNYLLGVTIKDFKTGEVSTISNAKSGITQTYRLTFSISESGTLTIDAWSKDGKNMFASTSFNLNTK